MNATPLVLPPSNPADVVTSRADNSAANTTNSADETSPFASAMKDATPKPARKQTASKATDDTPSGGQLPVSGMGTPPVSVTPGASASVAVPHTDAPAAVPAAAAAAATPGGDASSTAPLLKGLPPIDGLPAAAQSVTPAPADPATSVPSPAADGAAADGAAGGVAATSAASDAAASGAAGGVATASVASGGPASGAAATEVATSTLAAGAWVKPAAHPASAVTRAGVGTAANSGAVGNLGAANPGTASATDTAAGAQSAGADNPVLAAASASNPTADDSSAIAAAAAAAAAANPAGAAVASGDTDDPSVGLGVGGIAGVSGPAASTAQAVSRAMAVATASDSLSALLEPKFKSSNPAEASGAGSADPAAVTSAFVTTATTTPADAAATPALRVHANIDSAEFAQGLSDRVSWMVGNGLNGAKLQVNPPQLGPIELRIAVSGDHAQVWMSTHSAVTRDALESSSPALREMLGAHGFGQVSVDISQRSFQDRSTFAQPYESTSGAARRSSAATAVTSVAAASPRSSLGGLDAYA